MKWAGVIARFVLILFKAVFLALALLVQLVVAFFRKQSLLNSFANELKRLGISKEEASFLTRSYKDMVSLNVFSYINDGRKTHQ